MFPALKRKLQNVCTITHIHMWEEGQQVIVAPLLLFHRPPFAFPWWFIRLSFSSSAASYTPGTVLLLRFILPVTPAPARMIPPRSVSRIRALCRFLSVPAHFKNCDSWFFARVERSRNLMWASSKNPLVLLWE